jgi:hypothetical protein
MDAWGNRASRMFNRNAPEISYAERVWFRIRNGGVVQIIAIFA